MKDGRVSIFESGAIVQYVGEECEVGVVFLAFGGNGLRGFERLLELAFAEKGVGEIELHVVGIGIGLCGGLEMGDGVVVKAITAEKNADAGLRADDGAPAR